MHSNPRPVLFHSDYQMSLGDVLSIVIPSKPGIHTSAVLGTRHRYSELASLCGRKLLYVLMSLSALIAGLACGGSGVPDNPQQLILRDADTVSIVGMKSYLDAFELPLESDAKVAQEEWRDLWEGHDSSFGTDPDEIAYLIDVDSQDYTYQIVKGDFDFDALRNELEDLNFREDTYRTFQMWKKEGYPESAALFENEGIYVSGNEDTVKNVLKAVDRGDGFMDEEAGLRRALDTVGDGLAVVASNDCSHIGRTSSVKGIDLLPSCDIAAISVKGGNEDESQATIAVVFTSERRAESGAEDLEEIIEYGSELDADVEDSRVNGDIVTMKLTIYE